MATHLVSAEMPDASKESTERLESVTHNAMMFLQTLSCVSPIIFREFLVTDLDTLQTGSSNEWGDMVRFMCRLLISRLLKLSVYIYLP